MNRPYAGHGSEEFNSRLHVLLQRFAADVQRVVGNNLVALVLGGGYGRGEGGVVRLNGVEHPYNDLDFALVVRRKRAVSEAALARIGKDYEDEVKVHFEFGRPVTISDIRHWPHIFVWYALYHGHIVLAGPPDVIRANVPASLQGPMPPIEATLLLLNRGAGLLWAARVVRGVEPPPDGDFVRRNYYKCALALGDAILIAHQCFSPQYRGRDVRLRQLTDKSPAIAALRLMELYEVALQFKFCPDEVSDGSVEEARLRGLAERWGCVFLYIESKRTGREWPSLKEYVQWGALRELEQHTLPKLLRNLIRNRQIGIWSWRYPRERLYRQLPVLLGLTGTPVADWPTETARFLAVWNRFN